MIRPRYQILLGFGLLVAALVVACQDDPTAPRGPGSILLEIVLADDSLEGPGLMASSEESRVLLFGSLDRARAHARGPTNKTIELTLSQDDYFEGTITGLQPGSYTVAVEGLIGNEVDHYGETTSVNVSAGQNSTASISFRSFVPSLTTVPTRTVSRRFDVCYGSVSNATGYRVEWANNPSFTGLKSAQSTSNCAEVEVTVPGTYYVRVRALQDMSSTPGTPSDSKTVEVVAATVAVGGTVTGAEELEIKSGGATLELSLTDDQWVTGIGSDNAETMALLNGIVSNGSESGGWNAVVKPGLNHTHVARLSATLVRITLPEFPTYSISTPETITVTVAAAALAASMDAVTAEPTFTVTSSPWVAVNVTGQGSVASNPVGIDCPDVCSVEFAGGTTLSLTAEPAVGWGLQGWGGACTGTGTCQITLVQDTTVSATFVQGNFGLSVTVNGNGSVSSDPAGIACPDDCSESYPGGTDVTLTVDPDPGWLFSQWSGDCSGSNASTIVSMNSAKNCTATFVQQMFQLNVAVTGSGTVTSDPAGIACPDGSCQASYPSGTIVTLTAEPLTGWDFSHWSGDCGGTNPAVQVTMAAAKSCAAVFVQITYALGVTVVGSGSVTSNPSGITCPTDCVQSYASGTEVTLTAAPEPEWIFSGWSGHCAGAELTVPVTMDADKACTATFVEEYFPLNVIVSGSGKVNSAPPGISCPDDCGEPFLNGSTIALTATPEPGWLFAEWEGDCTGGELTVFVVMNAAKTCAATFIREQFPLEISVAGHAHGGGVVTSVPPGIDCGDDCGEMYDSGTQVTLKATPTPDEFWSAFSHWTGDCTGTEPSTTVTMDAAKVCGAVFAQAAAEVIISTVGAGSVTSQPAGIECPDFCSYAFPIPTQLALTATPAPGWLFTGWGGDCAGIEPTLPVVVEADMVCSANFVSRPEWIRHDPTSTWPEGRGEHTAVYVGATNEMVIFGGVTEGGKRLGDLWYLSNANGNEANPPAWRQVVPSGVPPAARNNHTAVYDATSDRMIVYGGYTVEGAVGQLLGDVWILTEVSHGGVKWVQLNPQGYDPRLERHGHTAVYDSDSNRMIVFGGETYNGLDFYPVWVLTNANGSEVQPPTWFPVDYGCGVPCIAPPAVLDHTAVYDDVNNLMITFGGTDYNWYYDDEHVYLNADAVEPSATYFLPYWLGTPPNGRYGHTTTYDRASNIMTLYGGFMGIVLGPRGAGPAQQADDPTFVWRLLNANDRSAAVWERVDAFGGPPPSRVGHTSVWDPVSKIMIVFGGFGFFDGLLLNDTWILTKANGEL